MKQIIKFPTFCLMAVFVFVACKKEKAVTPSLITPPIINNNNKPPVAHAGSDILIGLSCEIKSGFAALDGSGSSDPDNNIISYKWSLVNGPQGYIFTNPTLPKATVENLLPGDYAFELTVTDLGGLSSKDTMLLSVKGTPGIPKEYDLDMALNSRYTVGNYTFYDPWYNPDTGYYTVTSIEGKGTLLPFGEFDISIYEYADTAALSDTVYNSGIQILKGDYRLYISGGWPINLKKFIRGGGGLINSTFTIGSSSAQTCDGRVFLGLPPLTVTGSLDVATQTITLRIKGKVYF